MGSQSLRYEAGKEEMVPGLSRLPSTATCTFLLGSVHPTELQMSARQMLTYKLSALTPFTADGEK